MDISSVLTMPVPSLLVLGGFILILLGLVALKNDIFEMSSLARVTAFVIGIALMLSGVYFFVRASKYQDGIVVTPTATAINSLGTEDVLDDTSSETLMSYLAEEITLFETQDTYHIGDEHLAGWEELWGDCFTMVFQIDEPVSEVSLQFEIFGVNERELVTVNGQESSLISPVPGLADETWSDVRSIFIAGSLFQQGSNDLKICSSPLTKSPSFSGDKDDFQIRNIKLVARYAQYR